MNDSPIPLSEQTRPPLSLKEQPQNMHPPLPQKPDDHTLKITVLF